MNGQMDHLIRDATDRLHEQGTESADLKDVMLAGFGFMVYEIRKPKAFHEGKKGVLTGTAVGGTSVGLVEILLRFLGV